MQLQTSIHGWYRLGNAAQTVLRLDELEALASRMGALGKQLAQGGSCAAASGPFRVALHAALAVLARSLDSSTDHEVSPSNLSRLEVSVANTLLQGPFL